MSQSQLLVVLGPEHAATIAADGFTRADVQRFVFEHARLPLGRLKLGGMWGIHDWPLWMQKVTDEAALLPAGALGGRRARHGGGGPGKHSAVVPNCTLQPAQSSRRGRHRAPAEPPAGGSPALRERIVCWALIGLALAVSVVGHDGRTAPGGHDLSRASP